MISPYTILNNPGFVLDHWKDSLKNDLMNLFITEAIKKGIPVKGPKNPCKIWSELGMITFISRSFSTSVVNKMESHENFI